MPARLLQLTLDVPAGLVRDAEAFYAERIGLRLLAADDDGFRVEVGESALELRAAPGAPFYHLALLVPGERFEAALVWVTERVDVLPNGETGERVFDFTNWDARAVYFHDPAGSIVELIAHRGVAESGATGSFRPAELVGISEIGIVCDPQPCAEELARELGLGLWDGSVEREGALAFVGEKARTLILCREGRPWLPTGRPAEAHPVEIALAGARAGEVPLPAGGYVRSVPSRNGAAAPVQAS